MEGLASQQFSTCAKEKGFYRFPLGNDRSHHLPERQLRMQRASSLYILVESIPPNGKLCKALNMRDFIYVAYLIS
jgi:hypothetical protein